MSPSTANLLFLFLLLFLFSLLTATATAAANPPPSVYQVLQYFDFPAGLLPQGVTAYDLDPSTGRFSVSLDGSCSFSVEGYDLNYKSTISGTITKDRISDLEGIQVKILFFWINIIEVTTDGAQLDLSVGIASASFPIDNFDDLPQCGCGFDCPPPINMISAAATAESASG